MDIVGDSDYQASIILVWDISPHNPITLTPWDLFSQQAVTRLAFRERGYSSEIAARIMVF